ncbi:MAG: hypothetical protein JKY37_08560 [Nannocystaceae bacterium]|nr:hypothetical protein [Nannocystaceae bacterium]
MWVVADSLGTCPADAFGQFDPGRCVYEVQAIGVLDTAFDSGPLEATIRLEVPFLSNEDVTVLESMPPSAELFEAKVQQYPHDPERVPGGRAIEVRPQHRDPSLACEGDGCPCYEVGF